MTQTCDHQRVTELLLEQQIMSAVRVWRECPAEKRPSPDALAARIISILSENGRSEAE